MTIQKDKLQHFAVCLIAALIVGALAWLATGKNGLGCSIGGSFAVGLALGKEYGDKNAAGNHWCWWDLLADYAGILLAILLLTLAEALLEWLIQ